MDSISFKVEGLDKMIAALDKMADKVEKQVVLEFNAAALNIQSNAKKNAPVNIGNLRNSIQLVASQENNVLTYTVGTNVSYAPYIEFGTGGKVSVPNGYADFAMQFKGKKGGKFMDMVKALAEWVKRKGIIGTYSVKTQRRTGNRDKNAKQDMSVAYAIAITILRNGLRPQPFLIPAFESEKGKLKTKIKEAIQNAKS